GGDRFFGQQRVPGRRRRHVLRRPEPKSVAVGALSCQLASPRASAVRRRGRGLGCHTARLPFLGGGVCWKPGVLRRALAVDSCGHSNFDSNQPPPTPLWNQKLDWNHPNRVGITLTELESP